MNSNAIPQNETDQPPFIAGCQLQKLAVFLSRAIPSDPNFLDAAVKEITQTIDGTSLWGDIEGIGVAVHEALANAIVHGNHSDPEKPVDVTLAVNESCDLIIIVRDSGVGFNPGCVPNPTVGDSLLANYGRGIFLIRQFMDRVDFRFKQGTEIVMQRRRQWLQ